MVVAVEVSSAEVVATALVAMEVAVAEGVAVEVVGAEAAVGEAVAVDSHEHQRTECGFRSPGF